MAIGQLADYGRFEKSNPAPAVLLPRRPRPDLEQLLSSQKIAVVWKVGKRFVDNAGGRFSWTDGGVFSVAGRAAASGRARRGPARRH